MTLFIALGMGLTLALLGIASVLAHRQIAGRLAGGARLGGLLALLGPILITGIGAILFAGALLDQGPYLGEWLVFVRHSRFAGMTEENGATRRQFARCRRSS